MQEGICSHVSLSAMLILTEVFSSPFGVVQDSRKGSQMAGGMPFVGGGDAAGTSDIYMGDRHVEDKG
jgi:hypothetical protein